MLSPSGCAIRRMLSRVKYHRCCGGVISRQRAPDSLAKSEAKSPVVITMMPPGVKMARAERERLVRARQMLDDVEQHDDIHHPELRKIALVGNRP